MPRKPATKRHTAAEILKAFEKAGAVGLGYPAFIAITAEMAGKDPVQALARHFGIDDLTPAERRASESRAVRLAARRLS